MEFIRTDILNFEKVIKNLDGTIGDIIKSKIIKKFNLKGQLIYLSDKNGNMTSYVYDENGILTESIRRRIIDNKIQDCEKNIYTHHIDGKQSIFKLYNRDGRSMSEITKGSIIISKQINDVKFKLDYEYDENNRLIKLTKNDSLDIPVLYNTINDTVSYEYQNYNNEKILCLIEYKSKDGLERKVTIQNPDETIYVIYDKNGNMISEEKIRQDSITNIYNTQGHLVRILRNNKLFKDLILDTQCNIVSEKIYLTDGITVMSVAKLVSINSTFDIEKVSYPMI